MGDLSSWIQAGAAVATFGVSAGLWIVSRRQAEISHRQAEIARAQGLASMRIERAYVEAKLPKLLVSAMRLHATGQPDERRNGLVRLSIANAGNTPAIISAVSLSVSFVGNGPLPTPPPYDPPVPNGRNFLVKGGRFHFDQVFEVTESRWKSLRTGERSMLVFGYVDYRDTFGTRHRAGFARRCYGRRIADEALPDRIGEVYSPVAYVMEFEADAAYTFDRPRVEGEGDDW